ncbi:hypothetical protein BC939DRAFT_466532 [Gamsiella multidivaricata]|uniref:uncharacterized protein n=1 Tax=Gamsiella multidivaricata TaxID=101098 RepID=UPI00221EDAFB|nr:uncharacterized protein BC939DRAFT_466532 [Gamsiella multidivaricata]KAI7817243.1 hypothetical protein BC939DRAFT_466532 [Gamsiella multidivaricata]
MFSLTTIGALIPHCSNHNLPHPFTMHPATYTGGFFGLIVLILDLIAIFEVLNSTRSITSKLLWALLIFLFPVFGLIIYFLFGEREQHNGGYESIA